MNHEELLRHAGFVRALARSLVVDEHRAADVVQETWLAALKHPPTPGSSIRYWLSKVVWNCVRIMHRSESRRQERERAAMPPPKVQTPDEIVASVEARHQLVEIVLNLREPYRSTILLRFYEDLSLNEVAERLGVPAATVRVRLMRGLEMLKERLDAEHDGSRRKWVLTLAPFAGLKLASTSAGAATTSTAVLAGGLVMSAKLKAGLAGAILLGSLFAVWQILAPDSESDGMPRNQEMGIPVAENTIEDPVTEASIKDELDFAALGEQGKQQRTPIKPLGLLLKGRVVDKVSREPIRSFHLCLRDKKDTGISIDETVKNEEGCFSVSVDSEGPYYFGISSSRYISEGYAKLMVTNQEELLVALDPGLFIRGRVVDDETGLPVAEALVGTASHFNWEEAFTMLGQGFEEYVVHSKTGMNGHFTLGGLEYRWQKLGAYHPNYAQAWIKTYPGEHEAIIFRLKRGFRISGMVLTDAGDPLPGFSIRMVGHQVALKKSYLTDPDGRFLTDPVLPGRVFLNARNWRKKGEPFLDFTSECKLVVIQDQDVEVVIGGPSKEYVTWRGVVYDASGEPLSGARIYTDLPRSHPWIFNLAGSEENDDMFNRNAVLDEEGRFEFKKLPPGPHNVRLYLGKVESAKELDWGTISFEKPGFVERDIRLHGAEIRGIVIDEFTGEPIKLMKGRVYVSRDDNSSWSHSECPIDDEGCFHLTGLRPGRYDVWTQIGEVRGGEVRGYLKGVELSAHEVKDGIRVVIPRHGRVKIALGGFQDPGHPDNRRILYVFLPGKELRYRGVECTSLNVDKHGNKTMEKVLPEGTWTFSIVYSTHKGVGSLNRSFAILPHQVTNINIEGEELLFFEGSLTMEGSLKRKDGKPLAGAKISLQASSFSGKRRLRME